MTMDRAASRVRGAHFGAAPGAPNCDLFCRLRIPT